MVISRLWKHPLFEWTLWLGIPAVLYFSGWHTEVMGNLQRIVLSTGLFQPHTEKKQTNPVRKASYNVSLKTLNGNQVSLQDLKGKVIFMNIWATWCPPCVAEMPGIQKLYDKVKSDSIAFVMISVDENPEKLRQYIARKNYTFPIYVLADKSIPQMYATESIPATFVISASGKLVLQHAGMAKYNTDAFREFLQNQLTQ